ncbi:MAG: hypothetical protein L0177_09280 [Chloroflexi bacterium]|nr:hypothetical protein [Chloroflexota bacterium]
MIALSRPKKLFVISLVLLISMGAMAWSVAMAAGPTLTAKGGSAAEGQTVSVPIVLSEAPNGLSGFDITVTLSNGSIASISGVQMPDYGLTSVNLVSSTQARIKAADLKGRIESGAAEATLATLTLKAVKRGSTDIQIAVAMLDDDSGFPIEAQVVNGALTVKKATVSGGAGGGKGGSGGGKGRK